MRRPSKDRHAMLLTESVAQYRTYLRAMQTLRETTQDDYYRRVLRFARAHLTKTVADLDRPLVRTYLIDLAGVHPLMTGPARAAIRHWCAWLREEGWIMGDPCANIPVPAKKAKRGNPVADDIILKLIQACDLLPHSEFRRARARAVLSVLAYGALRLQEVVDLRLVDVHFEDGRLVVIDGKGGKERHVYPNEACFTALREYLLLRPDDAATEKLFIHDRAKHMATSGVYTILQHVKAVANLRDVRITPHMFRHACASRLANGTDGKAMPLPVLQSMLGHSDPATTSRYVHMNAILQRQYSHLGAIQPAEPSPAKPPETKRAAEPADTGRRRMSIRKRSKR